MEERSRFAAFRVIYGLVLLADVIHLVTHLEFFPNAKEYPFVEAVLILWVVALICLVAGYPLRLAAVANYLCCAVMLGVLAPNIGFQQAAGDSVAISLSLITVILSIIPYRIPTRLLLAVYLISVYLDSGIHKLASPMWWSGFGVSTPMGLPSLVWTNTSWMEYFPPVLFRVLGWGIIAFELSFPLFYAWRRTRIAALLCGIALHVGIGILYPIPVFSGLMLAVYAALLPEHWYKLLGRTIPGAWRAKLPIPRRLAAAALAMWVLAVAFTYAPRFLTLEALRLPLKLARKAIYVTTGVASHEVFADVLFRGYDYQLRVVAPDGVAVPYRRDNLFAWSVRDRVWEQWWKRTQAPYLPLHEAEASLGNWARCYSYPAPGISTVRVEARLQQVQMHDIDTHLFSRNNNALWRSVGSIQLSDNTVARFTWRVPPQSAEKRLGDYMARVLNAPSSSFDNFSTDFDRSR